MNALDIESSQSNKNLPQVGFTLVELMVAMTIGMFLSAGVISLLIGTRQSYRATEDMAGVQESGRFAIEYLGRNIREAGFREYDTATTLVSRGEIPDPIIFGWEGAGSDPTPADITLTTYASQTDILRIRYRYYFDQPTPTPGTFGVRENLFYIGTMSAGGEPGLRQRRIDTFPYPARPSSEIDTDTVHQELLEGVYNMQVRYGIDTNRNNQINNYVNADAVSNWEQVIAVRIDLLVGSREDNLVDAPMTLLFELNDGSFFTAPDRRIYQAYSTNIALRNRLP